MTFSVEKLHFKTRVYLLYNYTVYLTGLIYLRVDDFFFFLISKSIKQRQEYILESCLKRYHNMMSVFRDRNEYSKGLKV